MPARTRPPRAGRAEQGATSWWGGGGGRGRPPLHDPHPDMHMQLPAPPCQRLPGGRRRCTQLTSFEPCSAGCCRNPCSAGKKAGRGRPYGSGSPAQLHDGRRVVLGVGLRAAAPGASAGRGAGGQGALHKARLQCHIYIHMGNPGQSPGWMPCRSCVAGAGPGGPWAKAASAATCRRCTAQARDVGRAATAPARQRAPADTSRHPAARPHRLP